ncbi:MAG: ABC transporter permease [Clostridiales Family XIII bacterium]|jgi:ribose/xylose/arabinose/galactoside ABC-type transport system permease subunit|nr:ABC transporter permease [Clostridiales Family XIII bacterium]
MSGSGERLGEKRGFKWDYNLIVLVILVAFILIVTIMQLTTITPGRFPTMIAPANLTNLIAQVSATGMMAMGMAMVMIGGGIDLSVGMLTSFVVLHLAKSFIDPLYGERLPLIAAILLSIAFAVLMETGMGWIISRFKVEPFIITLGGMICFRGIALRIVNSQEVSMTIDGVQQLGEGGQFNLKANILPDGMVDAAGLTVNLPVYTLVFIGVTVLVWAIMKYSKYGRRIYAVGANPQAAYLAGIDVKNVILSTYTINGLLVGIASVFLLSRVNTAIITTGQNKEIDVIAAAVIGGVALSGGKGNIWGVFIGAILMGAIENGLTIMRQKAEMQYVAKGLIIIGAVVVGSIIEMMLNRSQTKKIQREEDEISAAAAAASSEQL